MVIPLWCHLSLGNDWVDYLKLLHLRIVLIELQYLVSFVVLGGLGHV